jgi:hypothetical protein
MLFLFSISYWPIKASAQVSLQTGSATFSLPLFNWQDDKSRLTAVVALSYNSGNGLRVNDVASNVGQGWSLIAGGEIIRMQAGEPDDQVERTGSSGDITKYPPGILFAPVAAKMGCPDALTKYPIYPSQNIYYSEHNKIAEDRELDYFSFQFNGKAGIFVLDPASISGNTGTGLFLGDTKMKVSFQLDAGLQSQGIRTKITSFTIEDVDGLKYTFSNKSLSKALRTYYTDDDWNYKDKTKKFKNHKVYYQADFE